MHLRHLLLFPPALETTISRTAFKLCLQIQLASLHDGPANPVAVLASQLPTASPDQQRMLLGEALYPLVDSVEPASSAKITGMLLEMDQSEVGFIGNKHSIDVDCRPLLSSPPPPPHPHPPPQALD